jgi:hypothetical protein
LFYGSLLSTATVDKKNAGWGRKSLSLPGKDKKPVVASDDVVKPMEL